MIKRSMAKATILMVTSCLFVCCNSNNNEKKQNLPKLPVKIVSLTNCSFSETYPATIKGKQDIDIRPQISGFITNVLVDEGALVKKNQILFVIDPVQYEEEVNIANAAVLVAKSGVSTAELTAKNKRELAEQNVIGDYEKLMAENALITAKARLAQAKSQLISAEKKLSYTRLLSPSDGIIGKIHLRVGALVSPSMATALTTVSENKTIYAYFSLTEKKLLSLMHQNQSSTKICESMPKVRLQLADGSLYAYQGTIETISGVIDQQTGSVSVRASFSNGKGVLRSGGTGSILLPYTVTNCITIPQKATFEIQDKKFVYKVLDNSTVATTEITVFPLNDGKEYVVTNGLQAGDKIVTEGINAIKNGMKIEKILN